MPGDDHGVILLSRLLCTQPPSLHSPVDSPSWQHNNRDVWSLWSPTGRVSEHLHLAQKICPCTVQWESCGGLGICQFSSLFGEYFARLQLWFKHLRWKLVVGSGIMGSPAAFVLLEALFEVSDVLIPLLWYLCYSFRYLLENKSGALSFWLIGIKHVPVGRSWTQSQRSTFWSIVLSHHFNPLHRSCTLELPCQHQQAHSHKLLSSLADKATESLWPAYSRSEKVTRRTFSALKIL